jgi:hypothetical protein
MDVVMAQMADPQQVAGLVVAALGAKRAVVNMAARPAFAHHARLTEVLKPEPFQRVWVTDTDWWAGVVHDTIRSGFG